MEATLQPASATTIAEGPDEGGASVVTPGLNDIHMLFRSRNLILGDQTLSRRAYARFQRWVSKLLSADPLSASVFHFGNVKLRLPVGAWVLLLGLGMNGWLAFAWHGRGLRPLDLSFTTRQALWSLIAAAMAVQTIYGCFLLGMLGVGAEQEEKPKPEFICPRP
jgi:hypothetical protein